MRLVKELKSIVEYLKSIEDIPTVTAANKVLFSNGSIEYNKRNMTYKVKTPGEIYQVESEELEELINEINY